jgi:uncharacterized protein YdeI (YjbR/CyaY-like superfamily)
MSAENNWKEELSLLKSIIQKAGLQETLKWGTDVFTYKGRNLISYAGFKSYFGLWFYNGVFLEDTHKVLVNAQENKTKALRQWRFRSIEEVSEPLILEYIREAIRNEDQGKIWKPVRSADAVIPAGLLEVLEGDKDLKRAFETLAPYKRKEYAEYIESAKREETRKVRIGKIKPLILAGLGLNDKYRTL